MQKRKNIATRQEEVFAIIIDIIAEEGIQQVSTKNVARRLGVSQPAFYKYFTNRDQMLCAFLDHMSAQLDAMLQRIQQAPNSEQRIQTLYREQLALIQHTRILPRVLFFEELHLDHGEKRAHLKRMVDHFEDGVRTFLKQGMEAGEIRKQDPDTLLHFLKGAMLSVYLKWSLSDTPYPILEEEPTLMNFVRQTLLTTSPSD